MRKWPVAQYYNYSSSHVALMARNARSLPSSSSSLPSEVNDTSGPDADTSSSESYSQVTTGNTEGALKVGNGT